MSSSPSLNDRYRGMLLGLAVGDALGLPAEGISRRRVQRLFPRPWRHHFLPGSGLCSDDTEHALFVSQCLLAHPENATRFARCLGWSLRWWLLALPAGVGFATLRAGLKLWLGFSPEYSGVFSAGNGPAMRVAPIGARFACEPDLREAYVRASTRLTHTDPRALTGARAIAEVIAWVVRETPARPPDPEAFIGLLRDLDRADAEWAAILDTMQSALTHQTDVAGFADKLGLNRGVSGYIYHTVPVALYAWYVYFNDFEATLSAILDLGGDTDTCGAIAGALAGTVSGIQGIPETWLAGLRDWPRSRKVLDTTATRLALSRESPQLPVSYFVPAVIPRNLLFLLLVLAHGLRRLLPPY